MYSLRYTPYATNVADRAGRVFSILIDDDSIAAGREGPVREAVHTLLTELAPGDRAGVLTAQGQVNVSSTDDPRKVQLAVDGLSERASAAETDSDAACRTTRDLAALGALIKLGESSRSTASRSGARCGH